LVSNRAKVSKERNAARYDDGTCAVLGSVD
jgi:hypothetical protein